MSWKLYFKVSPLPFVLFLDAKVRKKVETTKYFMLKVIHTYVKVCNLKHIVRGCLHP